MQEASIQKHQSRPVESNTNSIASGKFADINMINTLITVRQTLKKPNHQGVRNVVSSVSSFGSEPNSVLHSW